MIVNNYAADTLLKSAVVAPQLPKKLDIISCILHHGDRWKTEFRITGDKNASKRFTSADPEERAVYNAKDSFVTDYDDDLLESRLNSVHRGRELYADYLKLNQIGMQMRRDGFRVIIENKQHHKLTLSSRMRYARKELIELASKAGVEDFNPNAPEKIKKLFFDKYGVVATKWSEKTQAPSLDKACLVKVLAADDPIVRRAALLLIKYKKWQKLLGSYIKNLPVASDGKVHPCWNVSGAITGRWSCQDPALQTIPKPIIDKNKKGEDVETAPGLRDLFGADPGDVVIEVDFRQFEAYTIALMSGDRTLKALLDTGDVHSATAQIIFGLSKEDWDRLSKEQRKKFREMAKRARYALHYGAEPETAWRALVADYPDLTLGQILNLFGAFKKLHSDIVLWQQEQVKKARKCGYVECPITGRRYVFWGEVEASACYNIPNQMTVAKVMNDMIMRLKRRLTKFEKLRAQVHDSVLATTKESKMLQLAKKIKEECEKPVKLNGMEVSFGVDIKWGPNWGKLQTLEV